MRFRLWSALIGAPAGDPATRLIADQSRVITVLLVHNGADSVEMARDLETDGFEVSHERTGESGFFRATTETFDVVVLLAALPARGGLEVLTALRAQGVSTPTLLIASTDDVLARVKALDAGADDCVHEPVAAAELHARIRALARRGTADPVRLCVGDLVLDPMARTARRAGRRLQLTMREFQLLEYLLRHHGQVVSRDQLCRQIWRASAAALPDNVLDVHIARLRKKVDGGAASRLIHTVRGHGFVFGDGVGGPGRP